MQRKVCTETEIKVYNCIIRMFNFYVKQALFKTASFYYLNALDVLGVLSHQFKQEFLSKRKCSSDII